MCRFGGNGQKSLLVFGDIPLGFLHTGQKMMIHFLKVYKCMLKDTCVHPQASTTMLSAWEFCFSPSIVLCSCLEKLTGI